MKYYNLYGINQKMRGKLGKMPVESLEKTEKFDYSHKKPACILCIMLKRIDKIIFNCVNVDNKIFLRYSILCPKC